MEERDKLQGAFSSSSAAVAGRRRRIFSGSHCASHCPYFPFSFSFVQIDVYVRPLTSFEDFKVAASISQDFSREKKPQDFWFSFLGHLLCKRKKKPTIDDFF